MLRLHVQLFSHLVTVISKEIVVQWLLIASNRTADAGGVGGEDSTNLGHVGIDVKRAQSAHPLVGVINHLGVWSDGKQVMIKALRHQTSCIREHRGFVVVAIGVERVNAIVLPKPSVYLILLFEERVKVHKDSNRLARNGPTTNSDLQALLLSQTLPFGKEQLVFLEIGTFLLFPKVRTNKDNPVFHLLL